MPARLGRLSPHPGVSKGVHRSVIITIVCCRAAAAPDIFKSQGDSEISGENKHPVFDQSRFQSTSYMYSRGYSHFPVKQ